jgi:hypothetical protein
MTNAQAFQQYFDIVIDGIKSDAQSKNQRIPDKFRTVVSEEGGIMLGADYFKYLVFGRPPGKQPPTEPIEAWLKKVGMEPPSRNSKGRFIKLNYKSLAFAIAKIIGEKGTMIWRGDKPAIDFVGVLAKNRPQLLKNIVRNEAIKIQTLIHTANR